MPNRPESLYQKGSEKTPFRYPYFYPYSKSLVFPLSGTARFPISTSRKTVRIPIQGSAYGSMTARSHPVKSFTLRVVRAAPLDREVAAIIASNCLIGRPSFLHDTAILAYSSAASLSKLRSRPPKSSVKIASIAADRMLFREPSG
ncbi:hypothetical protein HDG32_002146 [Paraburkholderia sp. CI2]|uniref:hypothetical protein n=1 Tax=Paraburkholderia sp. CI2 TaxID=2723093 RepID=UPI0016177826|nr:hypothetical protein [Paraburkholderia sp. CI2]MBB5466039.1 hypothetical protein [Paraburkholderia sp. CI2]